MITRKFTITSPHFKANMQVDLPIDADVSPFQALVQLYQTYFKFATQQTLTFFKKPTTVTK
ncbi:hypothetical protein [Levilactobacillus enshiensis]|uniref:hypothetical protein n=1 Tax=Levilactobacillus enshiensis TaxID=2590213 RepID=UPI001179A033|nr:hypothetical protein [Levilactobacillus enshiensis]